MAGKDRNAGSLKAEFGTLLMPEIKRADVLVYPARRKTMLTAKIYRDQIQLHQIYRGRPADSSLRL